MKISAKISLGFLIIIVLSILVSYINFQLSSEVNQNTEFLTTSETIIRNSSKLHNAIIEMQSGFRGYLLTGNENFLISYYKGEKEIPFLFKEERILILNSPLQLGKLDSIQYLNESWISYANSLILAKKRTMLPDALSEEYIDLFENKLQKEVGKKINDQIGIKFREFDRFEYNIRMARRKALNQSIKDSRHISIILSSVIVFVGILSSIYITKIISKRILSMVKLADKISKGEFKIIEDNMKDELSHLSDSLNIMSMKLDKNFTELAKKNKELDQFAYVVSHDLKAPLRGLYNIFMWIEEDMGHEIQGQLKKYLVMMKGRTHRLESLISGLLEYARIGRVAKSVEPVNVKKLLDEITEILIPPNFQVIIKSKLPIITTEKLRLEQVFTNLFTNAVKYNGNKDGLIIVECEEFEDYYKFSVTDNGVGIAKEFHEKIFVIFQTLREKNELESTGIGLAIVKKIIEDQKGEIKVISEPGKGSTFTFTWPKYFTIITN